MGSRPEAVPPGRMPHPRRSAVLVAALWMYALAFGFLALLGTRLLAQFMGASGLRTGMELAIMAAAALVGAYLFAPATRLTRRFWQRAEDPTVTEPRGALPYQLALWPRDADRA